jgi:tetratricopeptide (TPR) repeat protein
MSAGGCGRRLGLATAAALLLAAFSLGCGSGAAKEAAAAPKLPPANPQAVNDMMRGIDAAERPDGAPQAIEHFQAALKADDKLWEARYDLGIVLARTGALEAAERELTLAAELAPNAEDVVLALGEVRRRAGNPEGAAEVLTAFIEKHPDALVARTALVTALRESGKVDEALAQAREVLVRRAGDPNALSELALAYVDREELDVAELLSQEALKAESKSAVAERTAGLVALERGDDAVAFQHFLRATELDPADTTARLNMGTVLLEAGVYDKASKHFRAVLEASPDDVDAAIGLAAALRGLGSREKPEPWNEAEELLKGVLQKQPRNLAATHNLGVLYYDSLKRPEQALPLLQRFVEDAPKGHPRYPEVLKLLQAKKP